MGFARFDLSIALLVLLLVSFFPARSETADFHFEVQNPPRSSQAISAHPTRADLFANLELNGEITLWRLLSGRSPEKILTVYEMASALALTEAPGSPFNSLFLVGTHTGELKIIDSHGNQICVGKDRNGADISHIVYEPENKIIVTGSVDGSINIWDMSCTLKKEKVFVHENMLTGLSLIKGTKRILSSSFDGAISAIDTSNLTSSGKLQVVPKGSIFEGGLRSSAVSQDGQRIALALQDQIETFRASELLSDLGSAPKAKPLATLKASYVQRNCMTFVPGDQYIIYGDLFEIFLWPGQPDTPARQITRNISSAEAARAIEFLADGLTVVTAYPNKPPEISRMGYAQEAPPIRIDHHRISGLAITKSNDIAVSSERGAIRIFNADGVISRDGADAKDLTFSVDLSNDRTQLIRAGQGSIESINLKDASSKIWLTGGYNDQAAHTKFLPGEGRFVATSSFGTLRFYSLTKDDPLLIVPLRPRRGSAMDLAVSPSGALIAVAMSSDMERTSKSRLLIFKTDGTLIKEIFEPHADALVGGVSFSRDEKLLVSYSTEGQIRIWSAETGASVETPIMPSEAGDVVGVRFINGDRFLLTVSRSGSVRVFSRTPNSARGRLLYETQKRDEFNFADMTKQMELSDDQSLLTTGSEHGAVTIWRLGLAPLFKWPPPKVETAIPPLFAGGFPPLTCGFVDNSERCWDPAVGPAILNPPLELGMPESEAVHGTRRLIAHSHPDGVVSIARANGSDFKTVRLNGGSGWIRWSIDGSRLFVVPSREDGAIHIADVPSDHRLASAAPSKVIAGRITGLIPLTGGGLAVEIGSLVTILDAALGEQARFNIPDSCGRPYRFQPITFSSDNSLAAMACNDGLLVLGKTPAGWQPRFQKQLWSAVHALHFASANKILITGRASGEITVWDSKNGDELRTMPLGRQVANLDSTGDTLIASSVDGQQRYFSLIDGKTLGLTVFAPEGITNLTADGWFSKLGADPPTIVGFNGEQALNDETVAKHLSADLVATNLFYRSSYLIQLRSVVIGMAHEIWKYVKAQSVYAQIGLALALSYIVFAVGLLLLWLIRPGLLCSFSLWLNRRGAIEASSGTKA